MNNIVTVQDVVTAFADFMEPTNAELDAIEQEMPRAYRRVLAAERDQANRACASTAGGAA
ncbi:DUF6284 family protein [Streptomyces sp. NPDC008141]|uniref:DUF6284 family protein n=1 Tax=Streptomyces sp. NPDC008141 TaxID=3364815 RepID=UPI0036EAFBB6